MAARPPARLPPSLPPWSRTHQEHRAAHHLRHALPQLGRRARLTQRPGELPSLRRGGEQRRLRHPRHQRRRRACSGSPAGPRRRQVRPRRSARPALGPRRRRLLPPPLAARPGGVARATPSTRCHAPSHPPRLPRSPALRTAPGLAKGNRACGRDGCSPMPPASPGARSPGRLFGAGCPARRGAGRAEEGPARQDSGPCRSGGWCLTAREAGSGRLAARCPGPLAGQVGTPGVASSLVRLLPRPHVRRPEARAAQAAGRARDPAPSRVAKSSEPVPIHWDRGFLA